MTNTLISVIIELLTQCNLRCQHCYLPSHINPGLEFEKVRSILYELHDLGTLNISLSGGEIFLREDIFDIIEIARNLHMRVFLLSNATLLDEAKIERLSKLNIAEFSTTVFSLDEKINDSITKVQGSLARILKNLELLKKYNIPVDVKTPLMSINIDGFRDVRRFCQDNGFSFLVNPLIISKTDGDESPKSLRISEKDMTLLLNEIDKDNRNKRFHEHEEDVPCSALLHSFAINCDGDVFPCNSFFYKVGNVFEDTLKNIWYESESLNYIKGIQNSDLKNCSGCEYKSSCLRCPAMAWMEGKDVFVCDTFAKSMAEIRMINKS